jgi:hypothetical protein
VTEQDDGAAPVQQRAGFRSRFFTGTPASGRPTLPFTGRPSPAPSAPSSPAVPLSGNAPPLPPTSRAAGMPFAGQPAPVAGPPQVSFANEPTEQLPVVTARRPPARDAGRVVLIYEQHIRRPWWLLAFTVSIVSLTIGVVLGQTEAYQSPAARAARVAQPQPSEVAQAPLPLTAPLGRLEQQRLEITGTVTTLRIRTTDLGESLYTIAVLGQGTSPQVTDVGKGLTLALTPGETGTVSAEAVLNSKVDWTLKLTGGVTELDVDSQAGGLVNAELAAGVSRGALRLPRPGGTVPLTITGTVGELTVRTDKGAPVRVRLGKGAGLATVNGRAQRGVKAGTMLRETGWPTARTRYDLRVTAQVGTILVERLIPGP